MPPLLDDVMPIKGWMLLYSKYAKQVLKDKPESDRLRREYCRTMGIDE